MKRREFNTLFALSSLAGLSPCAFAQGDDQQQRISDIIREYSEQGIHRTATDVDSFSAQWLANRIMQIGARASFRPFSLNQVNVVEYADHPHADPRGRRRLRASDQQQPIRIHVEYEEDVEETEGWIKTEMTKSVNFWSQALSLIPVNGTLKFTPRCKTQYSGSFSKGFR